MRKKSSGYTFLNLIKDVMEIEKKPLTVSQIWKCGEKHGLIDKVGSKGKTPINTLQARLYLDIRDNENSIFVQTSKRPSMFYLKDIDVDIPRDKLVIITGLSGSGKSSLAFDTIYAEGQRRYVESLSSYARMFLGIMDKPDVDSITGLSPAISIDQKSTSRNPRSTVATVTEVYDYLRLLFARVGVPHCPICHKPVSRRSVEDIVNEVMKLPLGSKLMLLAPIVSAKKGEFLHISEQYSAKGFSRVRVDGIIYALDEFPELNKNERHNIEIVVDRFVLNPELKTRISSSIEQALEMGQGIIQLLKINDRTTAVGENKITAENTEILTYSQRYACPDHPDELIPELTPRLFSFNAPDGACPTCTGLGSRME